MLGRSGADGPFSTFRCPTIKCMLWSLGGLGGLIFMDFLSSEGWEVEGFGTFRWPYYERPNAYICGNLWYSA